MLSGALIRNIMGNDIQYSHLSEEEKYIAQFLKELEYIIVNIFPIVKEIYDSFEVSASRLTPIRHKVDIKEKANEVWHQIFGATNEYLVKEGFVATPNNIDGQGRYLRSLIMPGY